MGRSAESLFLHLAHLIRSINDPEHPLTLEELNVVEQVRVQVSHLQHPGGVTCSRESERLNFAPGGGCCLSSQNPQGVFGRGWGVCLFCR